MSTHSAPTLSGILRRFRGRIAVTFSLLSLENVVIVATPLLLGLAIDGLLEGSLEATLWLAGALLIGTALGTGRRLFDTRTYSHIHATVANEITQRGWATRQSVSALSVRVELLREMVDFFEEDLVEAFNALVKILGAYLMLWYFNIDVLMLALAAAALIALVYVFTGERIYQINRGFNNRWEKQVNSLSSRNPTRTARHFLSLARWRIRLSDLEAISFAFIALVLIGLIIGSLIIVVQSGVGTPGSVFAILIYVLEITESAWMLPLLAQQFIRLREISNRLSTDGDTPALDSAITRKEPS